MAVGCRSATTIIICTALYFIVEFLLEPNVNQMEDKPDNLLYYKVLYLFATIFCCIASFMLQNWVFRLTRRLKVVSQDQFTVLRQMKIGCVLYSFDEDSILFCNPVGQ